MRSSINSYSYILLLFSSIALFSCQKTLQEEKEYAEDRSIESFLTKNKLSYSKVDGVYHHSIVPSYGYQVAKGDMVTFWYEGFTLDGKVFVTNVKSEAITAKLDTNVNSFDPVVTIAGIGNLVEGLDIGMLQLREGEVATLLFPSSLGFGKKTIGPINQWSSLGYNINLLSVSNPLIQKERDFIKSLNLENEGFLKDTNGLCYKYLLLGTVASPTINDTIYGWYKGTLPDGTIIDEISNGNQAIALSSNEIPIGIRLGFTLTKVGGSTSLVMPSYLAFGNDGNSFAEPYQTVFYQIRLDSIK